MEDLFELSCMYGQLLVSLVVTIDMVRSDIT